MAASTSTQDISEEQGEFASIPNLLFAGLGTTNSPRIFYRREAFTTLAVFVDKIVDGNHIGLLDGLPGTGKSSTLWWAFQQHKYRNKEVAWVHLDRTGQVSTFVKKKPSEGGGNNSNFEVQQLVKLDDAESIDADILVVDGASSTNYGTAMGLLRRWTTAPRGGPRSAFLTMSNKIKRLHAHELRVLEAQQKAGMGVAQYYCTQHSWSLDEYLRAFLKSDGTGSILFAQNKAIFEAEWEIEEDVGEINDSQNKKRHRNGRKKRSTVHDIVTKKFAVAGGSARWMVEFSTTDIETAIQQYLAECSSMDDLLSFSLGPESPLAKTHLYYSSPGMHDTTLYSMVSSRATLLAVEHHGTNGIKQLYKHATRLRNPAFLGWVIEADLLQRCSTGHMVLRTRRQGEEVAFNTSQGPPVEFDYDYLLLLYNENDTAISEEMKGLVPGKGETRTCKPSAWNQGGYDVVFITVSEEDERNLIVRFGQVTKSDSHSLKLKFYHFFLNFLVMAGYGINSVEVAFIVPSSQIGSFRITRSQVEGSGLLSMHTRFGTPPTDDPEKRKTHCFTQTKEQEQIQVYGLDMTSMDYPVGI